MITLENEGTASHPLGPLVFLRWSDTKLKLERYPVPSLSPEDEGNIYSLFLRSLNAGFQDTECTASEETFTPMSPVPWDLQQLEAFLGTGSGLHPWGRGRPA